MTGFVIQGHIFDQHIVKNYLYELYILANSILYFSRHIGASWKYGSVI